MCGGENRSGANDAVADLGLKAATAYGRPDLGKRLLRARERLADPSIRVLVVGEFKQGKSQLVNALVNGPVCPVDDDIATSLPTVVKYSESVSVTLVQRENSESDGVAPVARTEVTLEQLVQYVSEAVTRTTAVSCLTLKWVSLDDCWQAGWCWWTRPASVDWARHMAPPLCRHCTERTRCCWCPTPRRSTALRSWSSWSRPDNCARTWHA